LRAGVMLSHPSRKTKYAARMGHPDMVTERLSELAMLRMIASWQVDGFMSRRTEWARG
jgi:hypothetical protein